MPPTLQKFIKHRFHIAIALIAVIGLVLRLVVCYQLLNYNNGCNQVTMPAPVTDMAVYRDLALRIISGNFQESFYFQPFYYALFLPVIIMIFGQTLWCIIFIQALAGAASIYLCGVCAALLFGRTAGFVAALLTAFSSALILYTPFLLNETLQVFWVILGFYLCLVAMHNKQYLYWCMAGLVCGCSILTRGNVWCFIPGIIIVLISTIVISRTSRFSMLPRALWAVLAAAVFMLFLFLPQMPFIYRNSTIAGKITGPSTASGAVLALGNTPEAPPGGRNPDLPAGPMEYPPSYTAWTEGAAVKSVPMRIIEWAKREPLAYTELTFRKMLLFWDYQEIPNNISFVGEGKQSSVFRYTAVVPTGLIFALGLAGLFLIFRYFINFRHRKHWLLIYYILSFCGATVVFYILCRFRLPAIPLLAICAGFTVAKFIRMRRSSAIRSYYVALPVIVSVFICYCAYDFYRNLFESDVVCFARPDGVQVELSPNSYICLDNGPFSFGGWQPIEIEPGMVMEKSFSIAAAILNKFPRQEIELTFAVKEPGCTQIMINGEQHQLYFDRAGTKTEKYKISPLTTAKISVSIIESNTQIYTFMDTQRRYSRSKINGKNLEGEFVARLYLYTPERALPSHEPINKTVSEVFLQQASVLNYHSHLERQEQH